MTNICNIPNTRTINHQLDCPSFSNVKDLAFFDDKAYNWVVASDKFTLYCTVSSADIRSSVSIQVK